MLYCNWQVLLCTDIALQKDFAPRNMTSGGTARGPKKFSRFAIARHYGPHKFDVIRPLPRSHSRLGRGILPIPHPFDAFGISGHLRRLELGPPPTFQASYAPAHCKDKLNP